MFSSKIMLPAMVWMIAGAALFFTSCVEPGAEFTDGQVDGDRVQSVVGGECAATSDCWDGLRCLRQQGSRFCVQTCEGPRECSSGICNPVPGSRTGWCEISEEDLVATPGTGNSNQPGLVGDNTGGPAPAPGGNNPEGAPAPENEGAPTPPGDDGFVDDGSGNEGGGNEGGGDNGGGDNSGNNTPQNSAEAYTQMCSNCHGGRGEGGRGPALIDWDRGLSQLRVKIQDTMPPSNPEECVGECANGIAQYMLDNFVTGNNGGDNGGGGDTNPPENEPEPCVYPSGGSLSYNQTLPPLSWGTAFMGDGTQTTLSMEDLYCNPEYARYKTVTFVVGTGWCGACPSYIRSIGNAASQLDAAGGLLVFIEAEDNSYQPASSSTAHDIVSRYTTAGLRVGSAENSAGPRAIYNSSLVQSFPSCFMVRLSDMKIIADQGRNGGWALDWVSITNDAPERGDHGGNGGDNGGGDNGGGDNGGGDNGGNNNPPNNNGTCSEESSDASNNNPASATPLNAGDTVQGGVCSASNIDAYNININGTWRFDLLFSHAAGDLDAYVWNTNTNQPMTSNGQRLGSESTNDNESFTFTGPAVVVVMGYQGATAPYTLRVTQQ